MKKKTATSSAASQLNVKQPCFLTPRQAQLMLDGFDKLGWASAEVRTIAPAIDELERIAAMAPRPAPPPAPPTAA
jgi:hypothetical protein